MVLTLSWVLLPESPGLQHHQYSSHTAMVAEAIVIDNFDIRDEHYF